MKLYEIAPQFNALVEQDDFTEEDLAKLDELHLALKDKASNIVSFTGSLETFTKYCKEEEKRIAARRKAAENKIKWLNNYLKYGMEATGTTSLDIGTVKVSIQNNPPAVVVDDISAIPAKYFVVIPETRQLDKKMLKADLKEGEIAGAHLEQATSLRKR